MAGRRRTARPSLTGLVGHSTPAVAVAVALALAATHLPRTIDGWPYAVSFLSVIGAGVLLGLTGAWRRRRTGGAAPWLVVAALGCAFVGNAGYYVELTLFGEPSWPGWTDVFYVSHYALLCAAVLAVLRRRGDRNAAALIDAMTLSVGVGVVAYVFLVADTVTDPGVEPLVRFLNGLYPLLDVFVIGMVARLLLGAGSRGGALLLAGGMCTQFAGDMVVMVPSLNSGEGELRRLTDVAYLVCYVLLGWAMWHRDADRLGSGEERLHGGMGAGRLVLLGVSGLLAPAALLLRAETGSALHVRVIGTAAIALFLLTLTRMFLLVRAVEQQSRQLAVQARTDALTGLANRRTFDFELERAMRSALEGDPAAGPVTVALMDLDRFKRYNDEFGHGAGDQLLRECAAHWSDALCAAAPGGILARYGGEEFAVVLRGVRPEAAEGALRRLLAATPRGQTFSAGVAVWDGAEGALALLRRADELMYLGKAAGRSRVFGEPAAAAEVRTGGVTQVIAS